MNCNEARRHWNLYYDSEGDPELYFQINEHLSECADCAEWFHRQGRLEDEIAEKLVPPPATPELWEAVLSQTGIVSERSSRRWIFFGSVLTMAASLLVALAVWQHTSQTRSTSLSKLSAERHEQISSGKTPLDLASHSDLEIETYLRQRVSFPVRCPPRKDTGFQVAGAAVSQLGDEQTACVFGHVEGRPVSVFILSRESLRHFPHQLAAIRRDGIHRCREGLDQMVMAEIDRNVVLVIGRTAPENLTRVLEAYGTYPHRPAT